MFRIPIVNKRLKSFLEVHSQKIFARAIRFSDGGPLTRSKAIFVTFLASSSLSRIEFAPALADGVFHTTFFVALSLSSLSLSIDQA